MKFNEIKTIKEANGYYNPMDQERREQDSMDASKRDFKRQEMQHELGHEDHPDFERNLQRQAQERESGPWYIRVDGVIYKQKGAPKVFDLKKGANNYALAMIKNNPSLQGKIMLSKNSQDNPKETSNLIENDDDTPMYGAIIHRIMVAHPDLLSKYGPEKIMMAAQEEAEWVGDVEEIGSSDVSISVKRVMQALQEQNPTESIVEAEDTNPEDKICVDVPLFIRLMEYAREDAKSDMDLHRVTERLTAMSADGKILSMSDYDAVTGTVENRSVKPEVTEATGHPGYDNMLKVLQAVEAGEDAHFDLSGEPITLEYPEARFLGGKYKAFLKAGRQEEFLKYMNDPVMFDRLMKQLRDLIAKQKNFKGSVPGERGVEEGTMNKVSVPAALKMLKKARAYLDQFDPEDDDDYFDAYETIAAEFDMESNDSSIDPLTDLLDMYEVNPQQAAQVLADHLQSKSNDVVEAYSMADVREDARTFAPLSKDQYLAQKKALQDIQLDPQTANDPELRKELMRRTGALRKQAIASGLIGVEEDAPALAKMAGGLGLGLVAAAGAPAIVGILGPLLGIPFAAYGAYSAAKLGMKGVEKLWDMAAEKLGGDDKVEQYTTAQIAKLPPEKAQAATAIVKQVSESRKSKASSLIETADSEYYCNVDRRVKAIPEGYKKLASGYITRK